MCRLRSVFGVSCLLVTMAGLPVLASSDQSGTELGASDDYPVTGSSIADYSATDIGTSSAADTIGSPNGDQESGSIKTTTAAYVTYSDGQITKDDIEAVVCSKDDLPDVQIKDFDRCTRHISFYRHLNILRRCRARFFDGLTPNEQRLELCFNKTAEEQFKDCATEITDNEGGHLAPVSEKEMERFAFCMRTVASRPTQSVQTSSVSPTVPMTAAASEAIRSPRPGRKNRNRSRHRENREFVRRERDQAGAASTSLGHLSTGPPSGRKPHRNSLASREARRSSGRASATLYED